MLRYHFEPLNKSQGFCYIDEVIIGRRRRQGVNCHIYQLDKLISPSFYCFLIKNLIKCDVKFRHLLLITLIFLSSCNNVIKRKDLFDWSINQ
ncbi:hypothetical protein DERP_013419 [Dermatophagoides pteronyssinus]|uniref:Uncharacterized protein n=1 Tax=Dermatophagoides pteronyssinus TaxID=6956 RepID=A0ABQ8JRG0_DERPT|nr:hypothetical protein DERP_013419 [Dermatophagoides pteronyssinus]